MKAKVMTMVAILLLSVTSATGQEGKNSLGHGYRGFIDIEEYESFAAINLSTTHGYQFNPNIFVGLGVDYFSIIGGSAWLKHADFRYDKTFKGKYNLYFDLKIFTQKADNFVYRPAIGYRFNHFNINAGIWMGKGDNLFSIGIGWDFGGRKKK